MSQQQFPGLNIRTDDFVTNPSPRLPCVLLVDCSQSMDGRPIEELNAGLVQYRHELLQDHHARRSVEILVVRFGGRVELDHDFETAENFVPPTLVAAGNTPMAEAILQGLRSLEERKTFIRSKVGSCYRPWVFLITDGEPTDTEAHWRDACEAVRQGEAAQKFSFFAVGTEGANFEKLRQLSTSFKPLKLRGIAFRELFLWMSGSQGRVSQGRVGGRIALPPPTWADDWGSVPT